MLVASLERTHDPATEFELGVAKEASCHYCAASS